LRFSWLVYGWCFFLLLPVVVVAVFAKHHRSRIVKRECIRGLHLQIAAVCNLLYP